MGKEEGLILIVSDEETDLIMGVHILGPRATELVSLGVLAMPSVSDLGYAFQVGEVLLEGEH